MMLEQQQEYIEYCNYCIEQFNSTWSVLILVAVNWRDDEPGRSNVVILSVPFLLDNGDTIKAIYSYAVRKFVRLEINFRNNTYWVKL